GDNAGDGIDVQDPVLAAEHDLAHRRSDPGTRLVGDGPHVTVPNVDDVDARHVPESRRTSPSNVGPGKGRWSSYTAAIPEGVAPGDQPRCEAGARDHIELPSRAGRTEVDAKARWAGEHDHGDATVVRQRVARLATPIAAPNDRRCSVAPAHQLAPP